MSSSSSERASSSPEPVQKKKKRHIPAAVAGFLDIEAKRSKKNAKEIEESDNEEDEDEEEDQGSDDGDSKEDEEQDDISDLIENGHDFTITQLKLLRLKKDSYFSLLPMDVVTLVCKMGDTDANELSSDGGEGYNYAALQRQQDDLDEEAALMQLLGVEPPAQRHKRVVINEDGSDEIEEVLPDQPPPDEDDVDPPPDEDYNVEAHQARILSLLAKPVAPTLTTTATTGGNNLELFAHDADKKSAAPAAKRRIIEEEDIIEPQAPQVADPVDPNAVATDADPPQDPDDLDLFLYPHYHVRLWYSKRTASKRKADGTGGEQQFIDYNFVQLLLLEFFPDVLVSNVILKQSAKILLGAERYWLIGSDCTMAGLMAKACNLQDHLLRFRLSWEHLFAHKIRHINMWEAEYNNYMYHLRTKMGTRKRLASLSDRFDTATETPMSLLPQVDGVIDDVSIFNMKLHMYLCENNMKLKMRSGGWQVHELIPGMKHSYALKLEDLTALKAHMIQLGEGWENLIGKYAKGVWNSEFDSLALGRMPILERDWHWAEFADNAGTGGGGYMYICDDPHKVNPLRATRLDNECVLEQNLLQGGWWAGLPEWWPVMGQLYLQDISDKKKPLQQYKGRMGPFLPSNGFIFNRATQKLISVHDFVGYYLKGKAVGYTDMRKGMLKYFNKPDTEEGDSEVRRPSDWYRVTMPYRYKPCEEHVWRPVPNKYGYHQCVALSTGLLETLCKDPYDHCYYFSNHVTANEKHNLHSKHQSWGKETWVLHFMNVLRGAVEVEYWFRKRSLMIYGGSNMGKSTVAAPFSDNDGCMIPPDHHFIVGDGTKADILAGLCGGDDVKIALFCDFKPRVSFPDVDVLKRLTEGDNQSARGMKKNTGRKSANFFKFFEANYAFRTIKGMAAPVKQLGHGPLVPVPQTEEDIAKKLPEQFTQVDAGNPFGPYYDPDNAMSNRLSSLQMLIRVPGGRADTTLRDRVKANSMDLLVELATLRYVPLEERRDWRLDRTFNVNTN